MNYEDLLNVVADDATGRTLPPPSEIRRAGDTLRARSRMRWAAAAAAGAAVLALAGMTVVVHDDDHAQPRPVKQPSPRVTLFDQQGDLSYVDDRGTRQTLTIKGADRFAVSPDGRRVAYTTSGTAAVDRQLWTVDADGTRARRLPKPCSGCQPGYGVAWSHDGSRLAYVVWTPGRAPAQIRIRSLGDGHEAVIRMPPGMEPRGPSFSPDDRTLAFVADRWSHQYVASLEPARGVSSLTRLSSFYTQVQLPSWSEDGQTVYFTAITAGDDINDAVTTSDLYATRGEGVDERLTHAHFGERYFGATEEDGRFVVSRATGHGPWVLGTLSADGQTFTPMKDADGRRILGTEAKVQP